jgi:hypothetical protein
MRVSLEHGNSPTLHYVQVGPLEFAFSYSTIVAFNAGNGWVKSQNVWSMTTGKHLNEIPGKRIEHEKFQFRLNNVLGRFVVTDNV